MQVSRYALNSGHRKQELGTRDGAKGQGNCPLKKAEELTFYKEVWQMVIITFTLSDTLHEHLSQGTGANTAALQAVPQDRRGE